MALSDDVALLQHLHQRIPGVKSAPLRLPAQINQPDLPLVVVIPGPGTWTKRPQTQGWLLLARVEECRCYVAPVTAGAGVDEGFHRAYTLLQSFGNAYLFDITQGYQVNDTDQVRDSGVKEMYFDGNTYWGFTYWVRLTWWFSLAEIGATGLPTLEHAYVATDEPTLVAVPPPNLQRRAVPARVALIR